MIFLPPCFPLSLPFFHPSFFLSEQNVPLASSSSRCLASCSASSRLWPNCALCWEGPPVPSPDSVWGLCSELPYHDTRASDVVVIACSDAYLPLWPICSMRKGSVPFSQLQLQCLTQQLACNTYSFSAFCRNKWISNTLKHEYKCDVLTWS